MKSKYPKFILLTLITLSFCGSNDKKNISAEVAKIFAIKQSAVYNDLIVMFHPSLEKDFDLFVKLFQRQKDILGDPVSHKLVDFLVHPMEGNSKSVDAIYEVAYEKKEVFWERFSFIINEKNEILLIGYAGNDERDMVEPKVNQ